MFLATIVLSLAVLGPMGSHGLSTSKQEVVFQDDRPGEELLFLLKNLDKIRKNIPEEQEKNKSDLITDELKEAGMSVEEIDDLNKVAEEMEEFLSLIPDVHKQLELNSGEEGVLLYNVKLYLLGLPNSLGPLGYISFHSVMEDQLGEVINPVEVTAVEAGAVTRTKRSLSTLRHLAVISIALRLKKAKAALIATAAIAGAVGAAIAGGKKGGSSPAQEYPPLPPPQIVSIERGNYH